jgi:ZIP family zinc transporter
MNKNVLMAFGLTLYAGFFAGVGGVLAFYAKRTNLKGLIISAVGEFLSS